MNRLNRPLKIAIICGGSGAVLGLVAQLLKRLYPDLEITLIPPASDTGGGFKKVAPLFNMPFPSDSERCVRGLIPEYLWTPELDMLFTGRIELSDEAHLLHGMRTSNLVTASFKNALGDFQSAIDALCRLFKAVGQVTPMTIEPASIAAEYEGGFVVYGEEAIDDPKDERQRVAHLNRLFHTGEPQINDRADRALRGADIVIFSVGSFYTSLVAALTVPGAKDAIAYAVSQGAQCVYMSDTMTESGQTHDLGTVSSQYNALEQDYILGKGLINHILSHDNGPYDEIALKEYEGEFAYPVKVDLREDFCGVHVWLRDLLAKLGETPEFSDSHTFGKSQGANHVDHVIRHSVGRTAGALSEIIAYYIDVVGLRKY